MQCKRCGAPLSSEGYLCKQCGMMMDSDQIIEQKKYQDLTGLNKKTEFVSEKYGGKQQIFIGREEKEASLKGIVILFIILILLILIIAFGLFLMK